MRPCAVFDLDGTIIDHSSEQVFLKYLLEQGEIPTHNLLRWVADFIRDGDFRAAKANKAYLRGLSESHLRDVARVCFTERLVSRISPKVFELMASHRAAGRTTVILSGSLEILIRFFHDYLQTDLMVGNKLEVVDGCVTGKLGGLNPYGENKANFVRQLAEQHGFELGESYAYGNHHSDAHKLRLFGHPVAVNPDRGLRRIATEKGWQIEGFHEAGF